MFRIWESRLQLERSGFRVYRVGRVLDVAFLGKDGVVREHQLERRVPQSLRTAAFQIVRFTDFEAHPNGVQGHDGGEGLRGVLSDEPARLDQAVADTAA